MSPVATRERPDCGHKALTECPLTAADWEQVFEAWVAFKTQCRMISDRAHARRDRADARRLGS